MEIDIIIQFSMKYCCIFSMKMRNSSRRADFEYKFPNSNETEQIKKKEYSAIHLLMKRIREADSITRNWIYEFSANKLSQSIHICYSLSDSRLSLSRLSEKWKNFKRKTRKLIDMRRYRGLVWRGKNSNNPTCAHMFDSENSADKKESSARFKFPHKKTSSTAIQWQKERERNSLLWNEWAHGKVPFIHLKIHRIFHFVNSTRKNNVLFLQRLIYRQSAWVVVVVMCVPA